MHSRYIIKLICFGFLASSDTVAVAASQSGYSASVTTWAPTSGCTDGIAPWPWLTHYGGQICQVAMQPPIATGNSFTDLNMGGVSTAATPPTSTFYHGYSLPSPMSANNRYLAISDPNGYHYVVDRTAKTFSPIRVPGSTAAPIWDSTDDSVFYYLSATQILKYRIDLGLSTVWLDYTGRFDSLQNGGSAHQSSDGWTTFWTPNQHQVCAVDLVQAKTYCADYLSAEANTPNIGFSFIDYTVTTDIDKGSGKRYAMLLAVPALAVWSVDLQHGTLKFEYRGPEMLTSLGFNNSSGNGNGVCDPGENCLNAPHGDATSINGIQYFITYADTSSTTCERDLVALPIAQALNMIAARTNIVPLGYCSSMYYWPDFHIGCAPRTGACVVSTLTPSQAPYGNQIMLLQDLAHLVKLNFHHSEPRGSDTYWYSPRAALSPDGRYVIYDSNFGQADEGNGLSHEQVMLMRTERVTIDQDPVNLALGQAAQFSVSVPADGAVAWSISPGIGFITPSGLYTAPSLASSAKTITVAATKVGDPTAYGTALINLPPPVTISVSPASGVTLHCGQITQFTAAVSGGDGRTSVAWSIAPTIGSITSTGLYTAPCSLTSAQVVTVTAASVSDPATYKHVAVSLLPTVTVSLSPTSGTTLISGQTQQFTASVSGADPRVVWSISPAIGSITSTGLYAAPSVVTSTQTVTVTATSILDPSKFASGSLSVTGRPSSLLYFTLWPTTVTGGGASAYNYVYLTGQASSTGMLVTIASSNPAILQVPSAVTVSAGADRASFVIKTAVVKSATRVTIAVTAGGVTQSAALTVVPAQLSYFTLYPTSVVGGGTSGYNYIYLTGAAFTGGIPVTIASGNPAIVEVPTTVTVLSGADRTSFVIKTAVVKSPTTVTIAVTAGGVTQSAALTVVPAQLSYFTLYPTSVVGGGTSEYNYIYLTGAASDGGIPVTITSGNPAIVQVPTGATVAAGSDRTSFVIKTAAAATTIPVTITVTAGGVSQSTILTVLPWGR